VPGQVELQADEEPPFIMVRALQQRHVRVLTLRESRDRRPWQDWGAHDRSPRLARCCLQDRGDRLAPQTRGRGGRIGAVQARRKGSALLIGRLLGLGGNRHPLSAIARSNNPDAVGDAILAHTLAPPADSPKIVTSFGFPPKARAFARTQLEDWLRARKGRQ
jgi:hypothetical protein